MQSTFDLRDPICVCVAIREKVLEQRPNIHFYVTCNPGNPKPGAADEHYVALCERVYDCSDTAAHPWPGRFVGYITYRMKEVRFRRVEDAIPVLSSVELRGDSFSKFSDGKVHFEVNKVEAEDPQLVQSARAAALANPSANGAEYDIAMSVGAKRLEDAVDRVLRMIDGTLC